MARYYLELCCCPVDEQCVSVGEENYDQRARAECVRFKEMLTRRFPVPENVLGYFVVKCFPHDFGSYYEVCAVFDDADERGMEWAFACEEDLPAKWDDNEILPMPPEKEDESDLPPLPYRSECSGADMEGKYPG
jgi:hypothetical protein